MLLLLSGLHQNHRMELLSGLIQKNNMFALAKYLGKYVPVRIQLTVQYTYCSHSNVNHVENGCSL